MSKIFSILAGAGLAAALTLSAGAASATITTFADYSAIGTSANIVWKNSGPGTGGGTGGSIYTSNNSSTPGSVNVNFSFLQPQLSPYVTNITAKFNLSASVTNSPAITAGGFKIEPNISGSFSFLTTAPLTVGHTTYAAGSNLLTGTFNEGAIFGGTNSTSGSFSSATESGATITYSSLFLDFSSTADRDFALSFTSILPALTSSSGNALRSFKGLSTGSFSTDPAPIVLGVPEPATWSMMILGLGMLGGALRVRVRKSAGFVSA